MTEGSTVIITFSYLLSVFVHLVTDGLECSTYNVEEVPLFLAAVYACSWVRVIQKICVMLFLHYVLGFADIVLEFFLLQVLGCLMQCWNADIQ